MLQLRKYLKAWLVKLFSDSHSVIVSYAIAALLAGSYISLKDVRNAINSALLSPTPLWVSIALAVIVIIYTYLKSRSFQEPPKSKPRIEFFTTGKLKWKVTIHSDDWFEVDKYPFCTDHDVQFISSISTKYCPGILRDRCDSELRDKDHFKIYSSVKSMVESEIRNGKALC